MPSNDPMWYCHECRAEMRPLFVPDPHCASCNGTFVEQIDSSDDPRNQPRLEGLGGGEGVDGVDNLFRMLHAMSVTRPPGAASPTRGNNATGGGDRDRGPIFQGGGNGFSFEVRSSNNGGTTRRIIVGGPPSLRRSSPSGGSGGGVAGDGPRMTMPEYIRNLHPENEGPTTPNGTNPRGPFDNPMLFRQYILSMLPPTMMQGGPMEGGRMGDYVFSQDALEQIMNQLMENGHKPVPLPEKDIDDLPRGVLAEDSDLLGKDCQVCQDTFEVPKPEEDIPAGMLTTVMLPCKHAFHEDCIVPWLKTSGTCPVCRHALIAQPAPRENPPQGSGGGGGGSPPSPSGGPGGLFGSFFGFANPSSSSSSSTSNVNPNSNNNSRRRDGGGGGGGGGGTSGNIPGSWQDID